MAATGMQMSLQQNRSPALQCELALEQVLRWFILESGVGIGATAKLWDPSTWHRPVMEKRRAFTVVNPWCGFICRGHFTDIIRATSNDVFRL